jgi:hypothetical protein
MAPSQRSNVVLALSTNRFTLKSAILSSCTSSHGNIIILVVVGWISFLYAENEMCRIHSGAMYHSSQAKPNVATSPHEYTSKTHQVRAGETN